MNWFTKKAAGGDNPFDSRGMFNRVRKDTERNTVERELPAANTESLSRIALPTAKLEKPTLEDVLRAIVEENPNINLSAVADELYDRGITPYRVDDATLEELLQQSRPVQVDYDALPSSPNTYRLGKDGGLNRLAAIASGAPVTAQPEVDFSPVYDTALRQAAEEPGNNVASFSEKVLSPYMRAMASPYNSVVSPDMKLPKSIGNPIVRSAEELSRDNIDVSHAADALLGAPVEAEDVKGLLGQLASPRYKMKFNTPNLLPESLGEVPMGYEASPEGTEWDRVQAALNRGRGLKPLPEDAVSAPAAEPVKAPLVGNKAPTRIGSPDLIPTGAPAVAQPDIDFADVAKPVSSPLAIDPAELEGQTPSSPSDMKFNMPNLLPESLGEAPGLTLGDIEDSPRALNPFTPVEAPSLANSLGTRVLNQGPIYNFLDQLRAVENTPGSSLSDFPIR